MAAIVPWLGVQRKRYSLRSKPTLLHAEIWAKALLSLEMFSSSSQRSPEIRCSPALLLWLFYFSLQLYKCSAVEQSRAEHVFEWVFCLVQPLVETQHPQVLAWWQKPVKPFTLNQSTLGEQVSATFPRMCWMSSGCPGAGEWGLLSPRQGRAGTTIAEFDTSS